MKHRFYPKHRFKTTKIEDGFGYRMESEFIQATNCEEIGENDRVVVSNTFDGAIN